LASQLKALPVIGIWASSDREGSPPQTSAYFFNSGEEGLTFLNAEFLATRGFKIAIADFRGDGRPDFGYHAKILYGDRATPSRANVQGGTSLTIKGIGFRNGITATVDGLPATVTGVSPTELVISAPPAADGTSTITLQNLDGSTSSLIDSVTYGAVPGDRILLEQGGNPWTPVGGQTVYPFRVKVVQAD